MTTSMDTTGLPHPANRIPLVGDVVGTSPATPVQDAMRQARDFRKALGGGMRQAGVLAAAGLIALEEMPSRLGDDHANARVLAESVAKCAVAEIDLDTVQTNIVIFALRSGGGAGAFVAAMKERGVLAGAVGPRAVRYVTHMDVSREECEHAAQVTSEVLSNWTKA